MNRKKTIIIDGKEYRVSEDICDAYESKIVLESIEQTVKDDYYKKQSRGFSFFKYLIMTPVLLGCFGVKVIRNIIFMPIAWLVLKIGIVMSFAVFFSIFQSTLHWIAHEQATQIMDFIMLHLLGMGTLKTDATPGFFAYPQVEWTIIFVLVILMAGVETYELYLEKNKY